MSYFESLGKAMAAELARHPAQRERLRSAADSALNRHLARPDMARDAMPRSLSPRLGRDQDDPEDPLPGTMLDAEACMLLIENCVDGLDADEREKLLEQLANFFQSDGYNGLRDNNQGASDRRRSGARGSRRPAQDAAVAAMNAKSFAHRWPQTASLRFGGTGR